MARPVRVAALVAVALVLVAGCSGTPTDETTAGGTTTTSTTTTLSTTTSSTGTTAASSTTESTTTTGSTPATESTTTRTTTTTEPEPVDIPVEGDRDLAFDQNRVFERIRTMLDAPGAEPPARVILRNESGTPGFYHVEDRFFLTITGAEQRPARDDQPRRSGITLTVANESDAYLEFVLAHEFTHSVQFDRIRDSPVMQAAFEAETYQERQVAGAIIEGGASYVAAEYARAHMNRSPASLRSETWEYGNLTAVERLAWAPYHYGRQYVAGRSASAVDHWAVYESPPNTTEQVIHGYDPGTEPAKPVAVTVEGDEANVRERNTLGELYLRIALSEHLSDEDAARAAAGWGGDERVQVAQDDYVWAIRFDDAANATEFREAFARFLDRRATRSDGRWTTGSTTYDVQTVGSEAVVVLVGDREFVANATVSGDPGTVTVATGS